MIFFCNSILLCAFGLVPDILGVSSTQDYDYQYEETTSNTSGVDLPTGHTKVSSYTSTTVEMGKTIMNTLDIPDKGHNEPCTNILCIVLPSGLIIFILLVVFAIAIGIIVRRKYSSKKTVHVQETSEQKNVSPENLGEGETCVDNKYDDTAHQSQKDSNFYKGMKIISGDEESRLYQDSEKN